MKKNVSENANNVAENANNVAENANNVSENNVAENNVAENNETEEQRKAGAILRARLPELQACGLNFEKRTGSFFKASLVDDVDEYGAPRMDSATGKPIQKVRRLVIDVDNEEECANNGFNVSEQLEKEIIAKRCAAYVVNFEANAGKINEDITKLENELASLKAERSSMNDKLTACIDFVNVFELPERVRVSGTKISEKLSKAEEENAKLRAMLLAAGINPDNV